jgi:hypothetical protein
MWLDCLHPVARRPYRAAIKYRLDESPLMGPEKQRKKAIRTARCLSVASSRRSAFSEHRSEGGALVKAGPIVGVAFFWLLSFGQA